MTIRGLLGVPMVMVVCFAIAQTSPVHAMGKPANDRDRKSLKEWQRAIKNDDKAWIVKNSEPPIELSTCPRDKEVVQYVGDEIEHTNWIADYESAVTPQVKKAILAAKPKDLVKDYQGASIRRGNLVIWFFGETDYETDAPFDGYRLQSITLWPNERCAGVSLDPHTYVGPVPVTIQGFWAEGGACSDPGKRMVLKTDTIQFGAEASQKVINMRHAGPRGAFRSFDLDIEGDVANFVYDPNHLDQIDILDGWSSQAGNNSQPYKRCPADKAK